MGMRGKFMAGDTTTIHLIYVNIVLNSDYIGVLSFTTEGGITKQASPITGTWHHVDRAKFMTRTATSNANNAIFLYNFGTSDMMLQKNGSLY